MNISIYDLNGREVIWFFLSIRPTAPLYKKNRFQKKITAVAINIKSMVVLISNLTNYNLFGKIINF